MKINVQLWKECLNMEGVLWTTAGGDGYPIGVGRTCEVYTLERLPKNG